jgi:uncharacterized membrane-anchored protein
MTDAIRPVQRLNKVPEVTIFFWIIKILCTTVGETASDFLNVNLNLGLTRTSVVMGILLAVILAVQFLTKRYIAAVYWLTVILISIFGTLVTDNLTDSIGFPLEYSTVLFSALLLVTFAVWYAQERTLSMHSIVNARREAFYWLAVLFTFALGTAAGDLMAEALGLGYATTGAIIVVVVTISTIGWRLGLDSILAFWVVYIMTRPVGASLGDYLSQSRDHGGLGLGASPTTAAFTAAILLIVGYLSIARSDVTPAGSSIEAENAQRARPHVLAQVIAVAVLFLVTSVCGYFWRTNQLDSEQQVAAQGSSPLGNLSSFHATTEAMLDDVKAGDWPKANDHANDIEYSWDNAEARLRPMNAGTWTDIDDAIDHVLREVRAVSPNPDTARAALQDLLEKTANP